MKILLPKRLPRLPHASSEQKSSTPAAKPLTLLSILECGIIWTTAFILALSGLHLTQTTLNSVKSPEISVDASPGQTSDTPISGNVLSGNSKINGNHLVGDRQLPIYCVKTDKKQVALSFDAAWGNEDTKVLMDILAKYNVKVTFFMTGEWVEKYPEDVKYIAEQGHDLGNHSMTHPQMSKLSEAKIREEIQTVHDKVKELTGIEMELFRPPFGDYDNEVITTLADMGYYTIQWDVDSLDWKDYGVDAIIKTVCKHKNLKNGSIILMHNGAKYTPKALESVITGLLDQGYELVPISQLIIRENYHLDHTGMQIAD